MPDDKLKEAERTIAQEQAFMNEAGQRKDRWFYPTLAFYSIFGASGLAALSRQFSLDDVKRKMRKSVQPDAQI